MTLIHICILLWIHGIHTRQHQIKSQYHCTMNIVHTVVGSKDETKFDVLLILQFTNSLGNFKSSFNWARKLFVNSLQIGNKIWDVHNLFEICLIFCALIPIYFTCFLSPANGTYNLHTDWYKNKTTHLLTTDHLSTGPQALLIIRIRDLILSPELLPSYKCAVLEKYKNVDPGLSN